MKIFTKMGIKQKIISILVIILLFQYVAPTESKAVDFGGTLFKPIQSLVIALGDVGEGMLNWVTYGSPKVILTLSTDPTIFDRVSDFFLDGGVVGVVVDKIPVAGNVKRKITGVAKGIKNWGKKTIKRFVLDDKIKDFDEDIELPMMLVTPDKIFSNQIPLLDVNIINPNTYYNGDDEIEDTPVNILQKTISNWYSILRNIATVAFLSVLVYIGIRIIISSVASEKAKYKQMLMDWIVGLCLLFSMHYIMSFAIFLTESIVDFLDVSANGVIIMNEEIKLKDYNGDNEKVKDVVSYYNKDDQGNTIDTLSWNTDMAGYIRYLAQDNIVSTSVATRMGLSILYITLVIYTYMFMFQYLKRLLNIIFLTLISPFVALAYPLDKFGDTKAQSFNMWIKEYLTNLLLQPMHLILYTVLIGSAIELAIDYPLYSIIVFGFMLQAEKLIKKMFNLDHADTVENAASGAFTGAMVMKGIDFATSHIKNKGKGGNKNTGGNMKSGQDDSRIRLANNRSSSYGTEDEGEFIDNVLGAGMQPEEDTEKGSEHGKEQKQRVESGGKEDSQNKGTTEEANKNNKFDDIGGDNYSLNENGIYVPNSIKKDRQQNAQPKSSDSGNTGIKKEQNKGQPLKKERKKISKAKYAGATMRLYGPKAGRMALKMAAAAAGATALGMVGVAAGLASDDYTNVLKFGAAGATGGMMGGKILAEKTMDAPKKIEDWSQNKKDEIMKEVYKNDPQGYKEYLNEKSDREFYRNEEIRQKYVEAFGQNKSSEMMKKAKKYREHGVTDNDIIIKAMKQKSDSLGTDVDDDRRIVAAKLASKIDNEKDMQDTMERLRKRGVSEDKINEQEKILRNMKNMI